MPKRYEKPLIKKYKTGIASKFAPTTPAISDNIEGIKVEALLAEYGSPLFVYSERKINEVYQRLHDAFSMRYPKVQCAWSYKTNYLQAICTKFHQLGSWAEVVSAMEYEMAKKQGTKAKQIIFNGPSKPYAALQQAVTDGALINIDSLDELQDLERIADETGMEVEAGIRINLALGGGAMSWDRFGFNLESEQAMHAVKLALSNGKVRIRGLHSHIGTFIMDPDQYKTQVTKLAAFAVQLKNELGLTMEYIDIGGGFASENDLKGAYLRTSDMVPHFEQYADAICAPLLDTFATADLPLLILETGRAMIDEAGTLLSCVVTTKRLHSGKRALVLDAGVNLAFTSFWYDHDIIPTVNRGAAMEDHVVYGPLCMQIDVLRENISLPFLEKGDAVQIRPVGAYNNTQWMQFINLRPAVVMIGDNKETAIIRDPETVDYLQQPEHTPTWLQD